jgi:5-methylcytosine-specific restriction protein A
LNILQNIPDKESFRSVNSIALKLANFKRLDGNFEGKGMKMGGKMDREIWNEFHGHRNKLEKEASLIRHLYLEAEKVFVASDHKAGYYSDFLYKFHKNRETDPLIMKVKKEMILLEANELKCEVCGFNFTEYYGEIGNDLMEIHYCKEINNLPELAASDMNDFIMVCGNCHKVLDKNYGILDANDIRNIIKK